MFHYQLPIINYPLTNYPSPKTCIIIAGPTAVGKTSLAISLARTYATEIISADSRQCYKELDIGVAKPSAAELAAVHHYFINSHSIEENLSAASFEGYALEAADKIFRQKDVAIMVGGTGLYIKAFAEGLDDIPLVEEPVRKKVLANYAVGGIAWLQTELEKVDPLYFSRGETQNPRRMMRALEVKLATGQSIINFQTREKKQRPFNVVKIGLELPRTELYQRINKRVDQMMATGLLKEVESLLPYRQLNALQTVGYKELFDYFDGLSSLDRALELIKQNSRQYAKRQLTWFKKDPEMKWINVSDPEAAVELALRYAGIENGQ